jgi:hypothetical protein
MHVIGVIHTLNLSKQKYLGIALHQLMKWPKGSTRSCPFVVPVDALMTGSLALTHTVTHQKPLSLLFFTKLRREILSGFPSFFLLLKRVVILNSSTTREQQALLFLD